MTNEINGENKAVLRTVDEMTISSFTKNIYELAEKMEKIFGSMSTTGIA